MKRLEAREAQGALVGEVIAPRREQAQEEKRQLVLPSVVKVVPPLHDELPPVLQAPIGATSPPSPPSAS